MVSSMTAFAQCKTPNWQWELRSVNHKFLDLSFSLPAQAQELEQDLRNTAKNALNRGHIDATLTASSDNQDKDNWINENQLKSLLANAHAAQKLALNANGDSTLLSQEPLTVMDILRWPGVLSTKQALSTSLQEEIIDGFNEALIRLSASRQLEGESLKALFESRLASIKQILSSLAEYSTHQIEFVRARLSQRIDQMETDVNPNRVAQEVALLAQRADVDEEVDRMNVHIEEFEKYLTQNAAHGRRLGFIVQEMARESNTLAAKLVVPDAVTMTVDLKVLIDQIKEQVQNVE